MSKYAIQVKDVKKRFSYSSHKSDSMKRAITQIFKPKNSQTNSFYALDGVSFNVEKGDFFGILGRNGSGKSTLLKIIAEIYQPTSGSVKTEGKAVSFIELGVGFKKELTGRENVYLNAALLGFSKKEIDEMYDDIVEFAELEKFMGQSLKNYSSGMKVRLAFSVAIRSKADILILDEVLAVGDAAFKKKSSEYFKSLKDSGQTIVLVTHSMANVKEFCNKAIVIEEGKVVFEGGAEEAADAYLELFNRETPTVKQPEVSGRVLIEGVDTTMSEETIGISVKVRAIEDVDDVKVGVSLKNLKGKTVTGINTMRAEGGGSIGLRSGDELSVEFSSPNILGKNSFSIVAAAVTLEGEVLDKYIGSPEIVNDPIEVSYPTVLPAKVVIKKK